MADLFNPDFQDFVQALRQQDVRYILIGGYSVILHGYNRATGDMDILVEKSTENYTRLVRAFYDFGMSVFDMTADNFLNNAAFDVFTFDCPPVAIDILTAMKGVAFEEVFAQASEVDVDGLLVRLINYNHLIQAREAAERARDLNDIEQLKKSRE